MWQQESCDTAVTGALADALATNTNLLTISLMTYRELTPTAAAYLEAAFGRSSVRTREVTFFPTEAREAREQAVVDARKEEERVAREKAEQEKAQAEAAQQKRRGRHIAKPPKGTKTGGAAPRRVPSR